MRGERVIKNGFLEGCQTKRIDAVISQTPKTVQQIAKEASATQSRVRQHCTYWVKEQLFYDKTKDEQFYRRSGPQPGSS